MPSHDETVRDQFTRQAPVFGASPSIAAEEALEAMVNATAPGGEDTVLEVACGPGLVACAFAPLVRHVTGIDLTPAMIDKARALQEERGLTNMNWRVGDVNALPFPDGEFTIVTSRYAFHHLEAPGRVLEEMKRVCAPGGRVAIVDGTASEDPETAARLNAMEVLRDPSHTAFLPLSRLRTLFAEADFSPPRETAYRLEMELDAFLGRSFPKPGDEERIRRIFADSLADDGLGLNAHRDGETIRFGYPIAVLVADVE